MTKESRPCHYLEIAWFKEVTEVGRRILQSARILLHVEYVYIRTLCKCDVLFAGDTGATYTLWKSTPFSES